MAKRVIKKKPLTKSEESSSGSSDSSFKDRRSRISEYLSGQIEKVEAKTGMVANTAKYLQPQSTNSLCIDWLFNGGIYNAITIVSGKEQSGKTTQSNEVLASGIRSSFLWSSFIDAEGTLNMDYFASMMKKIGLDMNGRGKPFRYYKENVIESVFDYMVGLLNTLPRKIWSKEANCWTYLFPKRDPVFAKTMEIYDVKPDRSLTTERYFVCPTEYDGLEASFTVDSFAAMLTENDEDNEVRSKIRAAEAQAFSNHLKRVASKVSSRGVMLFGVNQTRESPNAGYGGPQIYQPGGKALGFYSSQRAEYTSRSSGYRTGLMRWDDKLKALIESSVYDGQYDRYEMKAVKNTKNKMGNPNKETWIRIWKSDWNGDPHGIDPAFDLMLHLEQTGQITKTQRKKGSQQYKFTLKNSVGSKRASLLNALPDFSELQLKALTLSEVYGEREMIKAALEGMNLTRQVGLRDSLFKQMKDDSSILALTNRKAKAQADEDEDVEAEEV